MKRLFLMIVLWCFFVTSCGDAPATGIRETSKYKDAKEEILNLVKGRVKDPKRISSAMTSAERFMREAIPEKAESEKDLKKLAKMVAECDTIFVDGTYLTRLGNEKKDSVGGGGEWLHDEDALAYITAADDLFKENDKKYKDLGCLDIHDESKAKSLIEKILSE